MYKIEIRKSEYKDFEAIRSLLIMCFGGRTKQDTALLQDVSEGRMLVAWDNNTVVSTLAVVYDEKLKGKKVICACTHPVYRKLGIMHQLFAIAIDELKGADKLYCEALRVHNQSKANLHEVLVDLKFRELQRNYLSWDSKKCRKAYGFSCALQSGENGTCTCCEDLWLLD